MHLEPKADSWFVRVQAISILLYVGKKIRLSVKLFEYEVAHVFKGEGVWVRRATTTLHE